MAKSFVTLEQAICPVCGTAHDTGALLLDKRMSKRFEKRTATHYALCAGCARLRADGYIALVAVTNPSCKTLADANRTGEVVHVREAAFAALFDIPPPEQGMAFCEPAVITKLKELISPTAI